MTQSSRHTPCAVAGRIRRGKSLVEMLVVITLMSGAMGICALTLSALYRTESQLRRDREQQLIGSHLADRWRADVHGAVACTVDKDCELTLADGRRVKYAIDGSVIHREVLLGAAVQHRDAFKLPKNVAPEFAITKRQDRNFAILHLHPSGPDQPPSTPVRKAVIEASLNLHGGLTPTEDQP
jgi:hypothetical protein